MGFIRNNNGSNINTDKDGEVEIIDNLESSARYKPLSANQGKILNEKTEDVQEEQTVQNRRILENDLLDNRQSSVINKLLGENGTNMELYEVPNIIIIEEDLEKHTEVSYEKDILAMETSYRVSILEIMNNVNIDEL